MSARTRSIPAAPAAQSQRLDKWLWAARWCKTRALAAAQCELGRVLVNGAPAKPAREVRIGDVLVIQQERQRREVEVLQLGLQRQSAPLAQAMYRETEASRLQRERRAELQRLSPEPETMRHGRPSKVDRRELQRMLDRNLD
ncbi:MAG: RNA-binding S4 domain-containing protein [Thiomonas sp.]|uniref:RNA-binding S4 domain-containing protein n=1 Tax=Thiomonas sp. TaxID=2047785 RepID=UPI002A365FA1|nr:RNA-binding S4 domain-containing protein [Thiomonas sp.]MDY0330282.1 RNA-binding S4 domain-containing protein [Thiomonas sp.]